MTISRSAGVAKESSRSISRARGNSTAKDAKQQTNPNKSSFASLVAALDDIEIRVRTGIPCGIFRLYQVLPKDVGDKVLHIIDTSDHTAVEISLTLDKFRDETGIKITSWIVQKHRRRLRPTSTGCSCLKEVGKA